MVLIYKNKFVLLTDMLTLFITKTNENYCIFFCLFSFIWFCSSSWFCRILCQVGCALIFLKLIRENAASVFICDTSGAFLGISWIDYGLKISTFSVINITLACVISLLSLRLQIRYRENRKKIQRKYKGDKEQIQGRNIAAK